MNSYGLRSAPGDQDDSIATRHGDTPEALAKGAENPLGNMPVTAGKMGAPSVAMRFRLESHGQHSPSEVPAAMEPVIRKLIVKG